MTGSAGRVRSVMLEEACSRRRQRYCRLTQDGAGQARRVLAGIAYARAAGRPNPATALPCVPGIPL